MEIYGSSSLITVRHGEMLRLGDLQTEHEDALERYGLAETAEYHLGELARTLSLLTKIQVRL